MVYCICKASLNGKNRTGKSSRVRRPMNQKRTLVNARPITQIVITTSTNGAVGCRDMNYIIIVIKAMTYVIYLWALDSKGTRITSLQRNVATQRLNNGLSIGDVIARSVYPLTCHPVD